ncbi:MAG: ATP-binding protein [Rhodobacter sp.]|nr:ATP-binding protein [Rhodobacter sp.]
MVAVLLANSLRENADFELVRNTPVDLEAVPEILSEPGERVDALVAVVTSVQSVDQRMSQIGADLVVAQIVIGSDLTRYSARNLGLDPFIANLRSFVGRGQTEPGESMDWSLVPERQDIGAELRLVRTQAVGHALLRPAMDYVDALLLAYHHASPGSETDVPGFARSPSSFQSLLTNQPDAGSGDLAAVAADLFERLSSDEMRSEPLAILYQDLALSDLEMKIFLLCLAPELDAKYLPAYGILNDDMTRSFPTVGLTCALLGERIESRRQLTVSAVAGWRLVAGQGGGTHADDILRPDPAVLGWVLGDGSALTADPVIASLLVEEAWPGASLLERTGLRAAGGTLDSALSDRAREIRTFVLRGGSPDLWRADAELAANRAGLSLLRLSGETFAALGKAEWQDAIRRIWRAALLLDLVPVLDLGGQPVTSAVRDAVDALAAFPNRSVRPLLIIVEKDDQLAADLDGIHLTMPAPAELSPDETTRLLASACGLAGLSVATGDCARLAASHHLTLGTIDRAVRIAAVDSRRGETDPAARLVDAVRALSSADLPRFASRVPPIFRLSDLVLPADGLAQLTEIAGQVIGAQRVLTEWGFGKQLPYGRGIAALFCGPSGTGKTMAAQAIAQELGCETFMVDLSRVVSKYIGESEKNLDAVFRDAERARAVLVFDEADAIFGKRSEIKDAHDRYANIEVAYLLQRIESYSGVVILTTNFRQNVDPAFHRRLRFVVDFPRPDAAARALIWRRCLPETAPLGKDVDLELLAQGIDVTGGHIRQITLRAAFAAASAGSLTIEMAHLVAATRAELQKLGQGTVIRDLDRFEAARRATATQAA